MTRGIIASPHRLASEAGAEVLRDGGNAIDAAVAANAVLCVVYPNQTSLGGDLVALVWPAGGTSPTALIAAGWAGAGATIDAVRARGHDEMPAHGPETVTVPGTVQGWGRLIERFGTVGYEVVLAPAAAIAQAGFIVTEKLAADLAEHAGWLMREPAAAALFPPLKAGMRLRNPDLSAALMTISRRGFYDFYRGELAAAIADSLTKRDGFLTAEDMATWRSEYVEPLSIRWKEMVVHQAPPPSQGIALPAMLQRLGGATEEEPGPPLARALRRARDSVYPLRDRYLADPAAARVPLAAFFEPGSPAAGEVGRTHAGDTVCVCCADADGNSISLLQSIAYPFGSGIVAEGTGILLHNRGCYFSLRADHPNRLAPHKRPLHTLMPGLVSRAGEPCLVLGAMGGDGQPQIQLQVLLNLARGLDPQASVAAPRVRVDERGSLHVEADYAGALELQRTDPAVVLRPPRDPYFGHAHALARTQAGWLGGADPRSDGSVEIVR